LVVMLKPEIGLAVIYHPYEEGAEGAPRLLSRTGHLLEGLGLGVISSDCPVHDERTATLAGRIFKERGADLICIALATWSSDHIVLDILEHIDVPVITWAFPGINTGSLCGCQQIDCVLRELGKEYMFAYGDSPQALREIRSYSRAVALRNKLRGIRLGLVGHRTEGMTEVAFDELALKSVIGPRVVHIGTDKLNEAIRGMSDGEAEERWKEVIKKVGDVKAKRQEGLYSIKAFLALKRLVISGGLSGLATGCYPDLMGIVCLAHSLLGEEGVVASCEGDVNSAVAMLMLNELTGKPVHNTDLLAINERDDSAVFSHCGSGGFSLAERRADIELAPVRLAHSGVCVLFPSRPGTVTLLNLVGRRDTYRMFVIRGQALPTKMVFPGNPIRIKMPISTGEFLQEVARHGFGHHWMIGYGDVSVELLQLGRLLGIQTVSAQRA